jgi:hypothetical protein
MGNGNWTQLGYIGDLEMRDGRISSLAMFEPESEYKVELKIPMSVTWPERIEKVIFNDPATIVFWGDGDKTVVKCHDEGFDKEKGLAMAIAKHVFKERYHKVFKKWCSEDKKEGVFLGLCGILGNGGDGDAD